MLIGHVCVQCLMFFFNCMRIILKKMFSLIIQLKAGQVNFIYESLIMNFFSILIHLTKAKAYVSKGPNCSIKPYIYIISLSPLGFQDAMERAIGAILTLTNRESCYSTSWCMGVLKSPSLPILQFACVCLRACVMSLL